VASVAPRGDKGVPPLKRLRFKNDTYPALKRWAILTPSRKRDSNPHRSRILFVEKPVPGKASILERPFSEGPPRKSAYVRTFGEEPGFSAIGESRSLAD